MANNPPSIKDNPFKRLDALRTKVSGVKAPTPAAAAPPVSSAIQEVRETTGTAAPTTTAPEKKEGYTYSSLPSLTGGPKRKIYKQPKKR